MVTESSMLVDQAGLEAWGRKIGEGVEVPIVLDLRGDLGAGKTTLARAIARGAGVTGAIPSPTYNLLFRYELADERSVVHADLYRLEDAEEVWELGWSELPGPGDVMMIEWGERAENLLPRSRWEIRLEEGETPELRRVRVRSVGDPAPIPGLQRSEEG